MFSARKLNLNQTSSCRCSGTSSEKHLFGATAEEKWPRFMKSRAGWTAGTDKDYLRCARQRRVEAGCRSSAGPTRQLLWAGFRVALLYSSPHCSVLLSTAQFIVFWPPRAFCKAARRLLTWAWLLYVCWVLPLFLKLSPKWDLLPRNNKAQAGSRTCSSFLGFDFSLNDL